MMIAPTLRRRSAEPGEQSRDEAEPRRPRSAFAIPARRWLMFIAVSFSRYSLHKSSMVWRRQRSNDGRDEHRFAAMMTMACGVNKRPHDPSGGRSGGER